MLLENAYALVIGIANYYNVSKLPSTVLEDAQDIYALLTDPRYGGYSPAKVQLLLDTVATKTAIEHALKQLGALSNPASTVLICVLCHGGTAFVRRLVIERPWRTE